MIKKIIPSGNHGYIYKKPLKKDYKIGASPIVEEVLQENGCWDDYLPEVEKQKRYGGEDKMACVTFSALNTLEILHKRKYNVEKNWSDRFTAKISGTTKTGNNLRNVAESIRKDGLVDEKDWGWEESWDEYYKEIPNEIKQKGKDFLNNYLINYEWVPDVSPSSLVSALKYAPLQVVVYWNAVDDDELYFADRKHAGNHAVSLYGYIPGYCWKIFDHYDQYLKKARWDFKFDYAFKYSLTKIDMLTFYKKPNETAIYLLGKDGLYHPIVSEKIFFDLFGEWKQTGIDFKIEEKDIPKSKISYLVGGIIV